MNTRKSIFAAAALGIAATGLVSMSDGGVSTAFAAERAVAIPEPHVDVDDGRSQAVAVLAGGCFWGVEGVFSHVKGVKSVTSGYHGGSQATAKYDLTNRGDTGHAEAVRIVYDPRVVSYGTLLRIYFSVVHDPTQLNRQGPDRGPQYRSAIVPTTDAQATVARRYIRQLSRGGYFGDPIVTKVESYKRFYPAEAYHQDFMKRNPRHGYIVRWDVPKLANFRSFYPEWYRASATP